MIHRLWTVLEVFPMRNTTNIRPISEYLSPIVGCSAEEAKAKLGIGQLFGARSSLVHHGKLPYGRNELGSVLEKIETIDVTILRSLGGLPYAGELKKYFE